MLDLLNRKIFKSNYYSGSLLDPESRWCILVQFEKFEQMWDTVKTLSVMTLHYHRLYQISSLEVKLSLEDMK